MWEGCQLLRPEGCLWHIIFSQNGHSNTSKPTSSSRTLPFPITRQSPFPLETVTVLNRLRQ